MLIKMIYFVLELTLVLRYLGIYSSEEETKYIFDEFDADGSGTIEFNEFLVLIHQKVDSKFVIRNRIYIYARLYIKINTQQIF